LSGISGTFRPTVRVSARCLLPAGGSLLGSAYLVDVAGSGRSRASLRIEIDEEVWAEEVGRLRPQSPARRLAEKARREIEADRSNLPWKPCEEEGSQGTKLSRCVKLYVPIGQEGASAAPCGFVFRLTRVGGELVVRMVAFGERHPTNRRTRSVYQRAHRRLHGRYP
jgi:hypothetical protein